jgi:hypothetical protein
LTVDPDSAAPLIFGLLSFAGDAGVDERPLGAAGAVESSTYVTPAEQVDALPATSVAVAYQVELVSSVTARVRPGDENAAAEPLVTGAPEQSFAV